MPQGLLALVVSGDRGGGSKAPPSLPPPTEAPLPSGLLPEGAVAAGRGRGRVGVELSEGEGNGCCLSGPIRRAGLPQPPSHRLLGSKPLPAGRAHTRSARRLSGRRRGEAEFAVLRV